MSMATLTFGAFAVVGFAFLLIGFCRKLDVLTAFLLIFGSTAAGAGFGGCLARIALGVW